MPISDYIQKTTVHRTSDGLTHDTLVQAMLHEATQQASQIFQKMGASSSESAIVARSFVNSKFFRQDLERLIDDIKEIDKARMT